MKAKVQCTSCTSGGSIFAFAYLAKPELGVSSSGRHRYNPIPFSELSAECQLLNARAMNVVNIGERYKRVTFTTHPHENKRLVNKVNVVRKFFAFRARELPN